MNIKSIKFITCALILLLGIIIITIFGYFSFEATKMNLMNRYASEAELVLKHTKLTFESRFTSAENVLDLLSRTEAIQTADIAENNKQVTNLLNVLQKAIPDCRSLQFGMESGFIRMSPQISIPPSYDPRKRNWYLLAKKAEGQFVWTEPYLDYMTQKITITVAKTVSSPSGKVVGVIAVDFDVSEISTMISNSRIGANGFVMLLSQNGTIIANRDDDMIGEHLFGNIFQDVISLKKGEEFTYPLKGINYFFKFDAFAENGMVLVTAVSHNEIISQEIKAFLPELIAGIIALLAFGIISYFFVLRGVAPVERLIMLMKQVEKGNYQIFADINDYKEVTILSKCFNSMIEGIRKRDEKLLASNKELAGAEDKLRRQYNNMKRAQQILKASEERIKRLAYSDSLTGLANREKLVETLTEALERVGDGSTGGAVMYIDLDNFKSINDTMGHTVGDKVLIEIAHKFLKVDYQEKTVARIGGDEFIILVNGSDYLQKILDVCNNIVKIFEKPVVVDTKSFNVTTSIGIVLYPAHGTTAEELMKKADLTMYRAKQSGKNCYRIFDESMELEIFTRVNIENGLRDALKNNELVLHYQPQYCLHNQKILCLEALLRWNSPVLGPVSPLSFIKVAEEIGMIVSIEKWVLKSACIFAKNLNEGMREATRVSVNISPVHIMQGEFVTNVRNIIQEVGVDPSLIGLEITETVMMESFGSNKNKLEELKKLGIEIHLDDFGSGYSSLNYLQNLPIDYVKIDKAFIDTLLSSERNGRITATIVDLAHNIGLRVIAEGVESQEQYDLLKEYNCDLIQGYYISRPLPMEDVIKLLPDDDKQRIYKKFSVN